MFTFKKKSGIVIPNIYSTYPFYNNIKKFLTRKVKDYQNSTFTTYKFFIEFKDGIIIPRYFPLSDYIDSKSYVVLDESFVGDDITIKDHIILREGQLPVVDYMLENDNGIIESPPGSGKTIMAINVICQRKKKTIILVHRDPLVDQWIERFAECTNLIEDDVIRLTSKNYKDALKKPIIISTVQTIVSLLKLDRVSFINELTQSNIGVMIGDEVHTSVGAPIFSLCSLFIPAKVVFGLSATPKRRDQNDDILRYHLGNIFVPSSTSETLDAKVIILLTDFGIKKRSRFYLYYGGLFQRTRYLNQLIKSKVLTDTCRMLVNQAIREKRNVILVSERIKHIEMLFDIIPGSSKSKFIQSSGLESLNYQITLATPGKIRDGVDAVNKDFLILTSPITNCEQMSGRILRTKSGKKKPIVVEIIDIGCREISNTFFSRLDFYESEISNKNKKKWDIDYYFIGKGGIKKSLTKNEALDMIKLGA